MERITPRRGRRTWRSSTTAIAPVVKAIEVRSPRLRKRGKPTGGPLRLPERESENACNARARRSSPEEYASLEFSAHHGAVAALARFHSLRSEASVHGTITVLARASASRADKPSTRAPSFTRARSSRRPFTTAKPQL